MGGTLTLSVAVEASPVLTVLAGILRAGVSVALAGDGRLMVQAAPMGNVPPHVRMFVVEHRAAIVAALERRRTLGDRPALRAWLCVSCQERYPGADRANHQCAVCGEGGRS